VQIWTRQIGALYCEVRLDGKLSPVETARFDKNVVEVVLDRPFGKPQFPGDFLVRFPSHYEVCYLLFPAGQRLAGLRYIGRDRDPAVIAYDSPSGAREERLAASVTGTFCPWFGHIARLT
jgi:hypothetical protein